MLNSHYDDDPGGYSAKRSGWLNQRRQRHVVDFLDAAKSGDRVLDLGAGTGDLALAVAAARPDLIVTGVEPLESYVAFAKERAAGRNIENVDFLQGFAEDLGSVLGTGSVDWVISCDVLHHVTDEQAVIDSVAAVCTPTASWLVIEPNLWNPYIFLFQALTRGERNFWPRRFFNLATAAHWRRAGKEYVFLIPSAISDPKLWMTWLEKRLEGLKPLGGGIALKLVRTGS